MAPAVRHGSTSTPSNDKTQDDSSVHNYAELISTDEPLIFHHGGKQMREYLNEAGLDDPRKDYDIRALCKTVVTNGIFLDLFEKARARRYPKGVAWLYDYLKISHLTGMEDYRMKLRSSTTKKSVVMVRNLGIGFLTLYAMEGTLSDFSNCGTRRLTRAISAFEKHPAVRYVSRGLLELTKICHEANERNWKITSNRSPKERTENDRRRAVMNERDDEFIDDLERAIFEGDMDWFRDRYDDVIGEREVFKNEDDDDKDNDNDNDFPFSDEEML